jgi:uncharacterized SAM-binding protein YcdF (DUF218 family)
VWKRVFFGASALIAALILTYLAWVSRQIEQQSNLDEERISDVILVLGAAEYRGKPSPVLEARLNHALILYLRGLAPYIITTGGAGGDPVFTEADVGRAYLTRRGVPSEAILVERAGSTTAESIARSVEIMRRMNFHSCVVVSDGYHIFRVKRMLEDQGIQVYGSPRPGGMTSKGAFEWVYFKQAIGYVLWQIGINI